MSILLLRVQKKLTNIHCYLKEASVIHTVLLEYNMEQAAEQPPHHPHLTPTPPPPYYMYVRLMFRSTTIPCWVQTELNVIMNKLEHSS